MFHIIHKQIKNFVEMTHDLRILGLNDIHWNRGFHLTGQINGVPKSNAVRFIKQRQSVEMSLFYPCKSKSAFDQTRQVF